MAATTAPNPFRQMDTGVYSFFGYPVPANITNMSREHDLLNEGYVIRWKIKGSNEIFSMDFPHATEENILAVIAAMRLSC